jgi:hypothetical protein
VLCCAALPCLALPCLALPYLTLPCLVLSCVMLCHTVYRYWSLNYNCYLYTECELSLDLSLSLNFNHKTSFILIHLTSPFYHSFSRRFGDIIDTVPRMAAVLYNDSCYIAHNCTLITHMYKEDLGKIDASLQDNSGFVDFILKFRWVCVYVYMCVCVSNDLIHRRCALSFLSESQHCCFLYVSDILQLHPTVHLRDVMMRMW